MACSLHAGLFVRLLVCLLQCFASLHSAAMRESRLAHTTPWAPPSVSLPSLTALPSPLTTFDKDAESFDRSIHLGHYDTARERLAAYQLDITSLHPGRTKESLSKQELFWCWQYCHHWEIRRRRSRTMTEREQQHQQRAIAQQQHRTSIRNCEQAAVDDDRSDDSDYSPTNDAGDKPKAARTHRDRRDLFDKVQEYLPDGYNPFLSPSHHDHEKFRSVPHAPAQSRPC